MLYIGPANRRREVSARTGDVGLEPCLNSLAHQGRDDMKGSPIARSIAAAALLWGVGQAAATTTVWGSSPATSAALQADQMESPPLDTPEAEGMTTGPYSTEAVEASEPVIGAPGETGVESEE
jgi:hypothetical protein